MLNPNALIQISLTENRTKYWGSSIQEAVSAVRKDFPNETLKIELIGLLSQWSHNPTPQLLYLAKSRISRSLDATYLDSLPRPNMMRIELEPSKSDNWIDFTFMDLFAGIGGFHLALASQGGSLSFASEIDNSAKTTYAMNFGVVPFGDIRSFTRDSSGHPLSEKVIAKTVPPVDIIAAGFPCQPFSLAGVSSRNFHGLEHGLKCEAQGTLFEDILLVARATKPDALILENVRNLASHDSGRTIRVIRNEIIRAGYRIYPEWNNSKSWAVVNSLAVIAQRRKRVYMVCIREDLAVDLENRKGPFEIPTFDTSKATHSLRDVISQDTENTDKEKFQLYGISKKLWQGHQRRSRHHLLKNNGFRAELMTDLSKPAPTLVARYYKDGKDCLIPNKIRNVPPRMLSPRECALLQTFPKKFWIPTSKTSAYKQFGNAITVEVARRIAQSLITYLYT